MKASKPIRRNVKRKQEKKTVSFKSVLARLKLTFVMLSIASILGVSGYYGSHAVQQFLAKPIASVVVSGDFSYLAQDDVTTLINDNIQKSFVRESLDNMREKLESNPWVDNVVLRREWPDTLHVNIIEERPIARWGKAGFVNYRGELVKLDKDKKIEHLPLLKGEEGQSVKLMNQYQLLSQMLSQYEIRITALEQSALGLWTIHLDNGWRLVAGRSDITRKVQRLMTMLANNKIERQQEIDVIDMRYENGLAVQWKAYDHHAKQSNADTKQKI